MMSLKSSCNYLYRYTIKTLEDISPETLIRRTSKRVQNCKDSFIFEISSDFSSPEDAVKFIIKNFNDSDLLLISPALYNLLPEPIKKSDRIIIQILDITNLSDAHNFKGNSSLRYLFCPKTKEQLNVFYDFSIKNLSSSQAYWRFFPYDQNTISSITVSDIANFKAKLTPFPYLEIQNTKAPEHYEFVPEPENGYQIKFENINSGTNPRLSIIIPTYNNKKFLTNVIYHLTQQKAPSALFEVIIADDGSSDSSSEIIKEILNDLPKKINIKYLYWPKTNNRGEQNFFRAGLVRNVAAKEAKGSLLMFLDSDMLVPDNFVEICINELNTSDVIQFQRFHINQELSRQSPSYNQIVLNKDTYIEEENYWSQLFFSTEWQSLPQYWKYTCTYALGISKENFIKVGMFKKYYISYGFEDTDLGYECHLRNMKFSVVKTPLKHLTAYDKMQYKNSSKKRLQLLRITAELFYLQHLNNEIYHLLIDFYRFQKPIKSAIRDLIS